MTEETPIVVTYKYNLPEHKEELRLAQRSVDFYCLLLDIYNKCRHVWKHEADATEEMVKLAEEIGQMINEANIEL